jgi:outer membrane protein insertion porin family
VIVRIEFEGNLLYDAETVKIRMRNKEGRRLDRALLDQDMEELHLYFREVEVYTEDVPGGIVLRFRVSENPLVVRIVIRGAAEMSETEIRGLMRTREGYPLSRYHLAADREDIVAAYRLRGFHFAHVPEPQITVIQGGGRRIDLSIVEGPKVEVSRILFRGVSCLSDRELRKVMVTQEPTLLERVTGAPDFREETLREDLVALRRRLAEEGFLDAEVFLDDLRFSDDKETVEIVIVVVEHQPYTVGEIRVTRERVEPGTVGAPPPGDVAWFSDERIRGWLAIRTGERYDGERAAEGARKVQEEYYARSYLDAVVEPPILRGRQGALVVDLELVVKEGAKFRLSRIDFVGNEFTRDKVLRREVRTAPGGYVDRNELDRGLSRIKRLQYFDRATMRLEDTIGPDGKPLPGWKSALYEVDEAKTGKFNFGLSVATSGGFGGSISYQKRNFDISRWPRSWADVETGRAFTGAGQELTLLFAPSTQVSQFAVGFREPYLFNTEFGLDTNVSKRLAFREDYVEDRFGYTLGISRILHRAQDDSRVFRARLGWRQDLVDLDDVDEDAVPGAFLFKPENELRTLGLTLTYGTVDDLRDPRWDTSSSLTVDLTGTVLGGEIDMWSVEARHRQHFVLHERPDGSKHHLTASAAASYAEPLEDTPEVPPYERFYAGGQNLRGFRFRGVGPHVHGNPTGGEWMALASVEYEHPVVPKFLSLVAFVDTGTVATTLFEDDAGLWRVSVGFGLRIAIPMITGDTPLALDFGWPLVYGDDDQRQTVSFSLGRSF